MKRAPLCCALILVLCAFLLPACQTSGATDPVGGSDTTPPPPDDPIGVTTLSASAGPAAPLAWH
jgi:hypothetical protein